MDAFFAAIEERDNPQFRGLPIVVGADPHSSAGQGRGRGVVSTANYKAREYGIHSAMPISRAWQLSQKAERESKPAAIFLPVNGRYYSEVSRKIMAILHKHVLTVEEASIDEAYLELNRLENFSAAEGLAVKLKDEIRKSEGLTASVGIGPNKLIAKIASARFKPDGLTVVTPDQVLSFLEPLSIREIPGIGPKTELLLNKRKIFSIRDLRGMSSERLKELLGKWGKELYDKARGIGSDQVVEEYDVKSIGEQKTFEKDTLASVFLGERLSKMASQVFRRMERGGFQGFRTVTLIVRFSDFVTKTRSHTLKGNAHDLATLNKEAMKLFLPFLDRRGNPKLKPIRLIGLRIEKLS